MRETPGMSREIPRRRSISEPDVLIGMVVSRECNDTDLQTATAMSAYDGDLGKVRTECRTIYLSTRCFIWVI